tara:strand:- start:306 stop:515 length:210 start_codon:yes stop_codon:yes gene_type:complete
MRNFTAVFACIFCVACADKFEHEKSILPNNNDSHQKREFFEKICQGWGYGKDSDGVSACFQHMRSQNTE